MRRTRSSTSVDTAALRLLVRPLQQRRELQPDVRRDAELPPGRAAGERLVHVEAEPEHRDRLAFTEPSGEALRAAPGSTICGLEATVAVGRWGRMRRSTILV